MKRLLTLVAASMTLAACTAGNMPLLRGPAVEPALTPQSDALACLAEKAPDPRRKVAVASVTDRTGKFSVDDGGYKVSQGPDLMAISAFAKTGAVDLVERLDTKVLEWELNYADKKVLGDGPRIAVTPQGRQKVAYRGIMPGELMGSDYYLVGGITSIDYNIGSAGAEVSISGIGGGYREFRLLVGVDLRLVETRTSRIAAVSSLQKQIVGYETQAGIFRFFGDTLVDVSAGNKVNEPISLGVRAVIERAVFDLVTQVYGLADGDCHELLRLADASAATFAATTGRRSSTAIGRTDS
ncbi:CsgG/HfaB family protein [Marinimicrococcus flavescens]|uniref:CsgG/HfaB family protein n=1 Tax=Marinimicrococcus flavescens TaxID=3031815 RepID=A0AAP3UXY9_9PROT|nr:CsgG/HfaB family protein [Marinimicrococcus flavescens]